MLDAGAIGKEEYNRSMVEHSDVASKRENSEVGALSD